MVTWQGRCRLWCTCLRYLTCSLFSSGDDLGDLQTVARIFADIFHSEGQKPLQMSQMTLTYRHYILIYRVSIWILRVTVACTFDVFHS